MTNTTCPYHMWRKQRKSTVSNPISLDLYLCRPIDCITRIWRYVMCYHYDLANYTYLAANVECSESIFLCENNSKIPSHNFYHIFHCILYIVSGCYTFYTVALYAYIVHVWRNQFFLSLSYRKNSCQVIKFIPTEISIAHLKVKQVFILETSFKHNTFRIAI